MTSPSRLHPWNDPLPPFDYMVVGHQIPFNIISKPGFNGGHIADTTAQMKVEKGVAVDPGCNASLFMSVWCMVLHLVSSDRNMVTGPLQRAGL